MGSPKASKRNGGVGPREVVIAHDYLNQRGGAERVVLEMAGMWPHAPIYTSLYRPDSTFPEFRERDIRCSFLDKLPVDRGFRALLPLYPLAFNRLGELDADIVLSSSSGWAHMVRTTARSFHVVYCYTPARWLYGGDHLGSSTRQRALRPVLGLLREWDRRSSRRADLYIAISDEVRLRIKQQYGVDAPVVYPPVDVDRFRPSPRGERLLVVSRLLPYKRVDLVVDAATRAGIGLDVVGTGPALDDLRRRAGPTVDFYGRLGDDEITQLMESCRAFCLPGKEDFGITPVEANAAGKPVVAYGAGGALETLVDGQTGVFFREQEVDAVLDAIRRCDLLETPPEVIAASAQRFSRAAFRASLLAALEARSANGGSSAPSDAPPPPRERPRVLMLGKGWFPDQLGGLDRYFRDLLEHQPESTGVVVGPASGHPDRVVAASNHAAALPWRLLAFSAAARRAAKGADVVDAHFALYAFVPLLLRRLRVLPLVVHFQGPWADENVAQGDYSMLRQSCRRALERAVYRRATRVIVLSSAFRRLLIERYGVSPWRVRVEPPGVDLDRFSPGDRELARERLGLGSRAFLAVCVRRLVPRMGLDVLLDAWAQALTELPQGAQLVVAGDGPLRRDLEERISSCQLGDSVCLLGRVDDDVLVDLYRAADVGVVPTRSFEGFGLVVIEAAACGTPTIVTQVGGLPEAVAGLDPSLIVPVGDIATLASRLIRAATVGGLPTRSAARQFAEGHSWDRTVDRNRIVCREAAAPEMPERRIRVVYLDHVGQLSGGEIALLRLLPHLSGVEPHVILAEDGPFADALSLAGISTEVFPMAERARGLRKDNVAPGRVPAVVVLQTVGYIVRLAIRLRRLRPDLVHTNSLKAGVYGSIAARLAGVPLVWHVRDRIATDYLPKPAVTVLRHMTRRLTGAVIANSHATMSTLDPLARPMILYSVVPEVLMPPAVAPQRAAGAFNVGMIGRFAPWKGQDLFLRAFAAAFPDSDVRCVLVGAALFGENDFEQKLRDLSVELGIAARVDFRGFRSDIWSELARMQMLVHASIIPEPFGQVVLEGMAAQVPVVAADAAGPAELITHDLNGVLYPIGDQAALADALCRLASDPERRLRLAAAGVTTAAEHRPGIVAQRMEDLYRQLVASTKST